MIGVDVVDIARLRIALSRSPRLDGRLFTAGERAYFAAAGDADASRAGTLAAKEAAIKALRLGPLVAWARRIEITHDTRGAPSATVRRGDGVALVPVSISHDGPVAVAVALAT